MTKLVGVILVIFIVVLIWLGVRLSEKDLAGNITSIKVFGLAFLLFVLALLFFTTEQSFCEILPFFCK